MRSPSLDHIQRLVDGAADDRVGELQRVFAPEEVKPNECGGSRTKLTGCHASKSCRVPQLDAVAQDRGRAEQGKRRRPQPSKTEPDEPRNALRSDLEQTRRVFGGRAGS